MKLPIRKKALIQTERLTLKPYEVKDVEALADLLMNQEIGKTFMVPDFQTRDQAIALGEKLVAFSCIEDITHLEFGTSVYITSLFCSGKKMGKLSERNRIAEIRKAQAGEPVAFMEVKFAIYPAICLMVRFAHKNVPITI